MFGREAEPAGCGSVRGSDCGSDHSMDAVGEDEASLDRPTDIRLEGNSGGISSNNP